MNNIVDKGTVVTSTTIPCARQSVCLLSQSQLLALTQGMSPMPAPVSHLQTTQIVDLMDDIKARWCASAPQRTLHPATRAGGLHCLVGTGTGTEPAMVAARLVADFRNCDAKLATPLARGASPDATGMVSPARMFARSLRTLTSPKPR